MRTWRSQVILGVLCLVALAGISSPAEAGGCSEDGWCPMDSGTTSNLCTVWGSGPADVFAVGTENTILHYDGCDWTPMPHEASGQHLYGVWGSGPQDVFAVGPTGRILHYDGSTWSTMVSGSGAHLNRVWGSGPSDVFVVADSGVILHYDGSSWGPMNSGTTAHLKGVWGSGPNDVYAVGLGSGTILHYNGSSWSTQTSGLGNHLVGVWASGPTDVFVVGSGGLILHYDGTDWTTMDAGSPAYYFSNVWGSGPEDVFAVGYDGVIVHYNGTSWEPMDSGSTMRLGGVWGSGPHDVFVVGGYWVSTILHYPDPETPGTLSGKITFKGRLTNPDQRDRAFITLKSICTGSTTEYDVNTDVAGNYTISDVPAGTYHVLCHCPTYLKKLVTPVVVPAGGTVTCDFELTAGDLTDDNEIDFADVAPLSYHYGEVGDSLPEP